MKKYIFVIFLFLLILILFSLYNANDINKPIKEVNLTISVYFCPEDYCKDILISYIKNSSDIKCAFYELNLKDIIDELKKKNSEIIIEDSTFEKNKNLYFNDDKITKKIINSNYSFITGYSKSLMHNKFCIFDKKIVFTGSFNPTFNDNYLNNNNILFIESEKISNLFLNEFEELKKGYYGKGKKSKNNIIYSNNAKIEVYFCPEDNCQSQVIKEIEKANYNIYFMTFSFTDYEIANMILKQKELKNISIIGIYDSSQVSNFSTFNLLKNFSILDKSKYKLHNKIFIIDNKTIITGSYNPTKNANYFNDENLLIIENQELASLFVKKFFQIYYQKTIEEQISELKNYKKNDLIITSILPNPIGNDLKKEQIEIYNPLDIDIDLSYFRLYNGKSNFILNGIIPNKTKKIIVPNFQMPNKNGSIYLIKINEVIDYFVWNLENNKSDGLLLRK